MMNRIAWKAFSRKQEIWLHWINVNLYSTVAALFVCFLDIKFGTILPSPVEST